MGIKNLLPFIRKNFPNTIKKTFLSDYKNKSLAIDSNYYIYRFHYGLSNNDIYEKSELLKRFILLHRDFISNEIIPIYVFDGKQFLKEKEHVKEQRKKRKFTIEENINKIKNDLNSLQQQLNEKEKEVLFDNDNDLLKIKNSINEKSLNLEKVSKQIIQVSSEDIENVKTLLSLLGATIIIGKNEAEATCSVLNRLGHVYGVVSEDSDVFAFGALRLISGLSGISSTLNNNNQIINMNDINKVNNYNIIKRDDNLKEYDIQNFLKLTNVSLIEFIDIAILCQCDFTKVKISGIGPSKAFQLIQKYKNIENCITSFPEEKQKSISSDFKPQAARNIFYSYINMETKEESFDSIHEGNSFSLEKINEFLRTFQMKMDIKFNINYIISKTSPFKNNISN